MEESDLSFDKYTPIVARLMHIEDVTWGDAQKDFIVRYRGRLSSEDSEAAYTQLAEALRPMDITPLFRLEDERHVILLKAGVIKPQPSNIGWNILMFVLTVASVLFTGAAMAYQSPPEATLWDLILGAITHLDQGLPFAVSMMAILLAHEFGHYLMGRYHNTAVTLPYYIPLPYPLSPFGTMGAFIQMKEIPKNRRHLLDIGIAGPLAGLIVAVIVLSYGIATSPVEVVEPAPPGYANSFEGNSLLYGLIKFAVKGEWLPSTPPDSPAKAWYPVLQFFTGAAPIGGRDVMLNGIAWAGWAGLLVTALNLIPVGQLDGGHLIYVLIGRRTARLLPFILGIVVLLGIAWPGWWLWALLMFFFGRLYAEPLDLITPLDRRRKLLAILGLVILALIFTPVPLTLVGG